MWRWLEYLKNTPGVIDVAQTGSRFICDPPPMNTDEDYVVLTNNLYLMKLYFFTKGYRGGGSQDNEWDRNNFFSLRNGDTNIILTQSKEYFNNFVTATFIAKSLNLLRKEDRIQIFREIFKE